MKRQVIRPVILCGGSGTRLWPVSRKSMPKQFARLTGEDTMLQETIRRLEDAGCGAPIFVTNEEYRFTVAAQAAEIGLRGHSIIIEPEARNTGPAICAAVEFVAAEDPEALLLVAPSDHMIGDILTFAKALAVGADRARKGEMVTFGIRPSRPETGYGYIELDQEVAEQDIAQRYIRFVEKPDADAAETMVADGHFLWNSGMFLLGAETARLAFKQFAPELHAAVSPAVAEAQADLDFTRLGASFANAPSIAFDRAVMEHTDGWVVPMNAGWTDLGSWQSLWSEAAKDEKGVAVAGAVTDIGCRDSLLFANDSSVRIVGIGLKNVVAVATRDAVLVADLDETQAVSEAVAALRLEGVREADEFPKCERPWGHYESLAMGSRFQVKSIVVKPGAKLSLQSHVHRAEHWVVVEGTATVTVGTEERLISENQSVYIPLGAVHRLENHGKLPLRLIEVQTGAYLGEDDILRYEDVYARA